MSDTNLQAPDNEFERLLKLYEYNIDYTEITGKLDDLTKLAAYVAGTSISRINLVDAHTLWTISNYGLTGDQIPRQDSICQYSVLEDDHLEIKNLREDERFKDKPYVKDDPKLNYYYGIPLKTSDNFNIGSLCLMDTEEHELSKKKKELLKSIANEVLTRIDHENRIKVMKDNMDEMKEIQRKVSHDIRGPIGGIIGIANILREEAEESKMNEFMELLEMINKGGSTILELADEILSNYHAQAEPVSEANNMMNLDDLNEKLTNLYKPQARNKNITFQVINGKSSDTNPFHKQNLLQILGNLITNAIKFTQDEGRVAVELFYQHKINTLTATVKDSGVGISKDIMSQLKSKQYEKLRSQKGTIQERGYGLGLQLAQHLTDSMNGSLHIESKEGLGTEIKVVLPV